MMQNLKVKIVNGNQLFFLGTTHSCAQGDEGF